MMILPFSQVELNSKEGFNLLWEFAQRNSLMDESPTIVCELLVQTEEEIAAESLNDYYETLRDAMPNP